MIEFTRLREVQAALAEAGDVKVPQAVRRVTVEGAKVIKRSIKDTAQFPYSKTGNLRRGVRYKASKGSKGMRYTVGAFGRGTAHRGLVIYGHRFKGGSFSRPNPFIERGAAAGEGAAIVALEAAATAAIKTVTG